MNESAKVVKYLEDAEELGHSIISDKNEIIELCKRQNTNREAIRAIEKSQKRSHFISVGGLMVKTESVKCTDIIRKDQSKIDAQINILRSNLKVKVNRLRDLEYEDPVPGLMLTPLSKDEMNAVRQVMGGHAV